MLLGLAAGRWMRALERDLIPLRLLAVGVGGVVLGLLLHWLGVCPIVKRIWTPSWTLFSGGLCFLILSGIYWLIEIRGYRRWTFPFVVIGANSIAAYVMAHILEPGIVHSLRVHLGEDVFFLLGRGWSPLLQGSAILAILFLILNWMYENRIFVRI
ncbi:MAG: hypothetical protein WKF37_19360 [Bryobacteraceae bacterium]